MVRDPVCLMNIELREAAAMTIDEGDPAALLEQMLESYAGQHFNKPSCFCDESQAAGG